jgi:hypothetical protein
MPKTKSHVTVGQLNTSLPRDRPFRHMTSSGVSAKPVQRAPNESRGERTAPKQPVKGIPVATLPPDIAGGGHEKRKRKIT